MMVQDMHHVTGELGGEHKLHSQRKQGIYHSMEAHSVR